MTDKKLFNKWLEVSYLDFLKGLNEGGFSDRILYEIAFEAWKASAKRDGFKLVPKKCTNNMAHAAKSIDARLSAFKYGDVWDAMLSAVEEE